MIPRHLKIALALTVVALIGAGVYMYQLKRRDERNSQRAADNRPVAAPGSGPPQTVQLAVAYDEDQVIVRQAEKASLPQDDAARAREILRLLLANYARRPSPHPVAEGADVNGIYFIAGGLCVVDLNPAFADGHRSGILVEQLSVLSMVETLTANLPNVRRVRFLVDGKDRETLAGHVDLTHIYVAGAVHEQLLGLQR